MRPWTDSAGGEAGENVALWMPNRPEWIHMLFALVKVV
ncbi:MAG: AMP-binding protein [SAR202 cluster bacterium]|nr:AMP-binding protein [SAR202 cluster bacterium]